MILWESMARDKGLYDLFKDDGEESTKSTSVNTEGVGILVCRGNLGLR